MTGSPGEPRGSGSDWKPYAGLGYAAIALTLISLAFNPLTLVGVAGIVLAWLGLRRIRAARAVRGVGDRVPMRGLLIATLVVAIVSTLFTGWNDLHLLGVL